MVDFNDYGETDSVRWSMVTLAMIGASSFLLLLIWDVPSLLETTGNSLAQGPADVLMAMWHLACLLLGLRAIAFMYLMKSGHMIVRLHEKKEDVVIHPLGIKKFVTFSSWTLILNVMYFFFATIGSFFLLAGTNLPSNLAQLLAGVFVTALGASFLTSTVVRYVILPENHRDEEHHKRQFWFQNQMMHNFCTIFLVIEILLTSPQLEFVYMLFGILIGLTYAAFAFPFAVYGGGYYCYSFIDPRLRKAPLFITMLALAISISYVGVWFVNQLSSLNYILPFVVFALWTSSIVQFSPSEGN